MLVFLVLCPIAPALSLSLSLSLPYLYLPSTEWWRPTTIDADESQVELLRARDMESDFEFAYRLQLEESIAASLSLHLSSSPASSSRPGQPPLFDFAASAPNSHGNGVLSTTDLLEKELDEFQREQRDRELSEAVARRMRFDLSRQNHDQRFARDALCLPKEEWGGWNGAFKRPFGEGSSLSASARSETYRLYFKGLASEEGVDNSKVTVSGGIGVAVCDQSDNLILEVTKPFEEVVVSHRIAEFKALIVGLETAVSLDLKRILIFCDYYPLYQYVTQRWHPKQRKIATLMRKVTFLQRKFVYSRTYLVARNNIKYAFKLARDAIVSQMTLPSDSNYVNNLTESCLICLEDTNMVQMFTVPGCYHRYCFSCMKQHVEIKLLQGILPECPHDGCKSELTDIICEKFLTPKLIDMMKQKMKENSIPVTEKVYCPYPRCSALMSKSEVSEFARRESVSVRMFGGRKCVKCYRLFCMSCKVPWHYNMTCSEYKRRNPLPLEDAKLKSLATRNLWRQCVKCNHMIELAEGCFHMTCRCGHEFCYTCGAEWKTDGKKKKPTCACPLFDDASDDDIYDDFTDYDDDDDEYDFYYGLDYDEYYSSDEDIF